MRTILFIFESIQNLLFETLSSHMDTFTHGHMQQGVWQNALGFMYMQLCCKMYLSREIECSLSCLSLTSFDCTEDCTHKCTIQTILHSKVKKRKRNEGDSNYLSSTCIHIYGCKQRRATQYKTFIKLLSICKQRRATQYVPINEFILVLYKMLILSYQVSRISNQRGVSQNLKVVVSSFHYLKQLRQTASTISRHSPHAPRHHYDVYDTNNCNRYMFFEDRADFIKSCLVCVWKYSDDD